MTRTGVLVRLLAGALVGYLSTPLVWTVASPVRFLVWVAAMGWAESRWTESANNPERLGSVGPLQYQPDTWASVGGAERSRKGAFWAGFYVAPLVANALRARPSWWLFLRAPVVGYPALRVLWRAGTWGDRSRAWELSTDSKHERIARVAVAFALFLWLVVLVAVVRRMVRR